MRLVLKPRSTSCTTQCASSLGALTALPPFPPVSLLPFRHAGHTLAVNFWWASPASQLLSSHPHMAHYHLRLLLNSLSNQHTQQLLACVAPLALQQAAHGRAGEMQSPTGEEAGTCEPRRAKRSRGSSDGGGAASPRPLPPRIPVAPAASGWAPPAAEPVADQALLARPLPAQHIAGLSELERWALAQLLQALAQGETLDMHATDAGTAGAAGPADGHFAAEASSYEAATSAPAAHAAHGEAREAEPSEPAAGEACAHTAPAGAAEGAAPARRPGDGNAPSATCSDARVPHSHDARSVSGDACASDPEWRRRAAQAQQQVTLQLVAGCEGGGEGLQRLGLEHSITRLLASLPLRELLNALFALGSSQPAAMEQLLLRGLAPAGAELFTQRLEEAEELFVQLESGQCPEADAQLGGSQPAAVASAAAAAAGARPLLFASRQEFYGALYGGVEQPERVMQQLLAHKARLSRTVFHALVTHVVAGPDGGDSGGGGGGAAAWHA